MSPHCKNTVKTRSISAQAVFGSELTLWVYTVDRAGLYDGF